MHSIEENYYPCSNFFAETLLDIRTSVEGASWIHDIWAQRSKQIPYDSDVNDEGYDVRTYNEPDETDYQ